MAGFGDPNTSIAQPYTIAPPQPAAPSRRSLPNGPCNFRDATVGQCGCDQFWDKLSAELHDEIAAPGTSSERSTWCVCGHHACFHLKASRAPERRVPSIDIPRRPLHATCNGQGQLASGAQCDAHPAIRHADENRSPGDQAIRNERILSEPSFGARYLQQTSQAFGSGRIAQSQDTPSQISTTGLPGIPSVCLLSRDQRPATNNEARQGANQSRQTLAGLGLSMMHLESMGQINCQQQSPTSTVPDDFNVAQAPQRPCSAPGGSTRANSVHNEANVNSPSRGILEHVYEFNRQIHLDVPGDTIPNTYNPEYVQSVTEAATPSAGNTPDLNAADRAVQEGKDFIDQLARMTSNLQEQSNDEPDRPTYATVPTQLLLTNPPTAPQEQLQQMLQSAPPQGLQKLVSYLAPLHNLLNSIPNVAKTMQELGSRLDMLENGSFNYVQPEDLNQTLEMYEGRLIDVEQRTGEHDRLLQALDDHGSSTSFSRRRIGNVTASFGSNYSGESTTSSALILAAMDRQETEMEIENIKERLEVLEAAAPPTSLSPWEVEVVLLPWGPELRGIWFSPEESMHDAVNSTTQSSEEWTQARTSKSGKSLPFSEALGRDTDSSPYRPAHTPVKGPLLNPTGGGWSSQDISNWASGPTDDWLFPKACGSNNLVYKRLQSRGFVRNVTFRGASAKDIQDALSHAFCDVFDYLQYDDSDENPMIAEYPGLRAPYIPLRKVLKETRLRFLTPAEMSSSALWSAQFLAAGVMMRVSGGKKRLYVTVREAYTQQIDRNEFVIMEQSWPELRQLPRYQPDQDSKMDGNDEHCQTHVPEADAKEACWQFVEAYDAPPASVHSSFGSAQSLQLSMRPADRQWRRSITPNSILKKRQLRPISPVSENLRRPSYCRDRTVSTSVVETFPPGSSKRRYNSSPVKQSFAPQHVSRTPSLSMVRPKRRRVASSSSPQLNQDAVVDPQVPIWNATPRRSREPPSPFFSSQPPLQRSTSEVTSRPSQRSVAVAGKSTPFAYATPHSGPVLGGPAFDAYNNGGDTEPDDDDNDAYDGDDGEQSWHGVTDGDNDSVSDSARDAGAGAQEAGSFSGDDSGFDSDNSDAQSDEEAEAHAQRPQDEEEDEDEEDVFDSLLSVIED